MANWFSTETMFVLVLLSCMRLSCELFDRSVSGFITVLLLITDIISTPSNGSKIQCIIFFPLNIFQDVYLMSPLKVTGRHD